MQSCAADRGFYRRVRRRGTHVAYLDGREDAVGAKLGLPVDIDVDG